MPTEHGKRLNAAIIAAGVVWQDCEGCGRVWPFPSGVTLDSLDREWLCAVCCNAALAKIQRAALLSSDRAVQPEVCLCAAILMPDGFTIRGHRHDDCLMTASGYTRYDKGSMHKAIQGFLTTADRFVTREEGMTLMKATDRISSWTRRPFTESHDMLFSEDLY